MTLARSGFRIPAAKRPAGDETAVGTPGLSRGFRPYTRSVEAALLIGVPGSGKSTFFRERLVDTHVRINMDMLRTRHRERLLLEACLRAKQPFAVDNTNVTRVDRVRYLDAARASRFRVVGYFFVVRLEEALDRNRSRSTPVPEVAVRAKLRALETPRADEGFDSLFTVSAHAGPNGFAYQLSELPE